MRRLILTILLLLTAACLARDIRTKTGEIYKDVAVTRVEATGISITHRDGVAFLDFKILPIELQKEYGYSAEGYVVGQAANREQATLVDIQRRATVAALAFQQLADQQRQQEAAAALAERQRIAREQAAAASAAAIAQRDYGSRDYTGKNYGTPRYSASAYSGSSTGGSVQVRGYYRKDGTYVRAHSRSR